MPWFRRTRDERGQKRREKQAALEQRRERAKQLRDERRETSRERKEREYTQEAAKWQELVQPGEDLLVLARTEDAVMKKWVLVTSRRLLIGSDATRAYAYPGAAITGYQVSSMLGTKTVTVWMSGDKAELNFR